MGLGCLLLMQCKNGKPEQTQYEADTVSVLGDHRFEKGLSLKGTNSSTSPTGKYIYPFGGEQEQSVWELAEWGSKYQLSQEQLETVGETKIYRDPGKAISFAQQGSHVTMTVTASQEYDAPRKNNEAWPHLLIEQAIPSKPLLKALKGLLLQFDGRLVQNEMKMTAEQFDPGLHTAQFQLFLNVQDLNPESPAYGDYLWFGIPFYDYRHRQAEVYAAQDVGKGDATGKFIYSLANTDFMEGSYHDGEWIRVEKDLYPFIMKALEIAKERGYLKNSALEDFRVSGMNLGWEVPGTFDVSFEFKEFDLKAIR